MFLIGYGYHIKFADAIIVHLGQLQQVINALKVQSDTWCSCSVGP